MGSCDDDAAAGLRANMERKRILNARQTSMRQRKFQMLAKQKEEEEKRHVKEVLECRRNERARLAAYLHASPLKNRQQITTQQSVAPNPSKPCIVQNQGFAVPLRESMKSSGAPDNSSEDSAQQIILRMASQISARLSYDDLTWDQPRRVGSCDEETDSIKNRCASAKNLRVTFDPASVRSKENFREPSANICQQWSTSPDKSQEEPSLVNDQNPRRSSVNVSQQWSSIEDHLHSDLTRSLSPTVVLDGPDPDSSSNSSFLAQNVEPSPESRNQEVFNVVSEKHKSSMDDMNAFLEEALKLRLDNETATNRMIAELTGLQSRLDELHATDGANHESAYRWCRRDDEARESKVYRSEAWEVCNGDNKDQQQEDEQAHMPSAYSEYLVDTTLPSKESTINTDWSVVNIDENGQQCSGNYALLHMEARRLKQKARKADLIALSKEESNVLASIERLDWKLSSAIARCRDMGLSDGNYSVQSAPTVLSHGRGSTTSRVSNHTMNSVRAETSQCLNRPKRRQNVGLTNKHHERYSFPTCNRSHPSRSDNYSHMADRTLERCTPINSTKQGVIVFHPDAYYMLNPVASP